MEHADMLESCDLWRSGSMMRAEVPSCRDLMRRL